MKFTVFVVLFSLNFTCAATASKNSNESGPVLFGAEVEIPVLELVPLVKDVDFEALYRFFFKSPSLMLFSKASDDIYPIIPQDTWDVSARFAARDYLHQIFDDQPIKNSGFINHIKPHLKEELLKGLLVPQGILVTPGSQSKIKVTGPSSSMGLQISDREGRLQSNSQQAYQNYWQIVNQRWNSLPLLEKMKSMDWEALGQVDKAKLILVSHQLFSNKSRKKKSSQAPARFRIPLLKSKGENDARSILSRYYSTHDGLQSGVVEFHTSVPKPYGLFMEELSHLLNYFGKAESTLRPKPFENQRVGLHVHISSPLISEMSSSDFKDLKALIGLRALEKGDFTVLVDPSEFVINGKPLSAENYSIDENVGIRDVMGVHIDGGLRIEIRYFVEDVDSELAFYNKLFGGSEKEFELQIAKELQRLRTRKVFDLVKSLRPDLLLFLFPLSHLQNMGLKRHEIERTMALSLQATPDKIFEFGNFKYLAETPNGRRLIKKSLQTLYLHTTFNALAGNLVEAAMIYNIYSAMENSRKEVLNLLSNHIFYGISLTLLNFRSQEEDLKDFTILLTVPPVKVFDLELRNALDFELGREGYRFKIQDAELILQKVAQHKMPNAFNRLSRALESLGISTSNSCAVPLNRI